MTQIPEQERVRPENLRDLQALRRSATDRKIAGVAGGLGHHLNVDPTVLRVAFVVLCFFGGAGLLLYGAAWLLVPQEGRTTAIVSTSGATRTILLTAVAVLAALLLLGDSFGGWRFPWPLAVLALVAFLLLKNRDRTMRDEQPPSPPPGSPGAAPYPGSPGEAEQAPAATATLPPAGGGGEPGYAAPPPWMPPAEDTGYRPPPPRSSRGPRLFGITLAVLAIALGTLWLYDTLGGAVTDAAYPALALAVIGAMLVLGAFAGRAGGLIALGLVAALALAGTSIANPSFSGPRTIEADPVQAAQVKDRYYVPAGSIRLDLSDVNDLQRLDGRTIQVKANAGDVAVTVPDGVDVRVDADIAAAGQVDVLGQRRGGTDVHLHRVVDGGTDVPQLDLNLDLVVGSIEVRQS